MQLQVDPMTLLMNLSWRLAYYAKGSLFNQSIKKVLCLKVDTNITENNIFPVKAK